MEKQNMTLYEFRMLEEQLQIQTVWKIGKHIETVKDEKTIYLLYAINEFYVEIKYCQKTNQILGWLPFKQGDTLEKYLPKIKPLL